MKKEICKIEIPRSKKLFALVGKTRDECEFDYIMDWDTGKLCIYDDRTYAKNALEKYLKTYHGQVDAKIIELSTN